MAERVTKAAQSERTRTALLTTARKLFAEQGYANTATEDIVRQAGVTRGALYYHFQDKAGLFRAVFDELEEFMQQEIARSTEETEGDLWQQFWAGAITFFSLCARSDIQRILYIDGPAVLSADTWRTTITEAGIDTVRQHLRRLMEQNYITALPLEALTHLWFGAYAEAALYIARTEDQAAAQRAIGQCVEHLAKGMRLQAQAAREGPLHDTTKRESKEEESV